MIERLAQLENVTILIKVHNFFFTQYQDTDWKQKLTQTAEDHQNVFLVTRPNTQEIFPLGDMLITDTGTTAAFEFSLTKKPLFVFYNQDWFAHNEHCDVEKEIIKTAICFTNINEIVEYTRKLQKGDAELMKIIAAQQIEQENMISKFLFNQGCATQAAVKVIEEVLKNR
jgi:CDP-glycerol glycerophosphotransferase (TagB/SpsB family)